LSLPLPLATRPGRKYGGFSLRPMACVGHGLGIPGPGCIGVRDLLPGQRAGTPRHSMGCCCMGDMIYESWLASGQFQGLGEGDDGVCFGPRRRRGARRRKKKKSKIKQRTKAKSCQGKNCPPPPTRAKRGNRMRFRRQSCSTKQAKSQVKREDKNKNNRSHRATGTRSL